jgi:hypothetical protein
MTLKNKIKPFLYFVVALVGIISLSRFCHRQTEGFRISKIQSNFIPSLPKSHSEEEKEFLNALLRQKFVFLGRGLQSFVFASEDGQYVIKVFNNRYQQKITLFSWLSHFPFLSHWAKERASYYQRKLTQTFNSYQIAMKEMKDQTGLIYTHLFPTLDLPSKLTLIDKINIAHTLNPNHLGFLVQKRATLVFPTLKEYIDNHDIDGAKSALASLLNLFFWKWDHAILDNDPLIRANYGFIDGKAVQIDVGPLSKAIDIPNKKFYQTEIHRITASLKFWLTENDPELARFLDQELQQHLSSEG